METTFYFPDYVDGSGWSVQLALSNVGAETAAEVSVEVFDEEGQPVRDLFDAESAFQIPSLGSRVLKSYYNSDCPLLSTAAINAETAR